ncbi:N(6)-adenine-specific methyltransferase METTL4 [Eurosta solidaginis]|uniref:N(6)-adenine-specific methyltransferase METTL4 n=1 Tax=Eurosta solidaginis TaxID=178769 RepID=UPI003530CFEB
MRKIVIRNNITAIYLDHRELINNMYNKEIISNGAEKFKLCPELFYFHERPSDSRHANAKQQSEVDNGDTSVAAKPSKSNKRKLDKFEAITELQSIQIMAEDFVQQLNKQKIFERPNIIVDSKVFPRFWEEIGTDDFPQFNGANTTTTYQHCRFGNYSYLIPPNCRFFNCDVMELPKLLPQLLSSSEHFDLIVLDPPWRNKYIRRLKRARKELGYQMLNIEQLSQMPIKQLIHERSIVAIWCTNSREHQRAIVDELLPTWHLRLQHKLYWLKLNTSGKLIRSIDISGVKKQPFEMLYIACHMESTQNFTDSLQQVKALVSVPSIVHSHKPPILPWLSEMLPEQPNCLEIFARYLQPQFTSIGLEVLKLMDDRLYSSIDN